MKQPIRLAVKALLFLLLSAGLGQAADLKVGANVGNVPWEFQDKDGNIVGFEVDLVNAIGERLGHTVEFVNIPFNGLFAAVQSGRIDAAVSSITITDKRLESVSFAQPYYDSDQSLTVNAGGGVKSLDDLAGKVVGVDTGSTGDMWTSENQQKYGIGEIRRYEGLQPAMLDLAAARLDGYVSDIPALQYYTQDKPDLEVVQRIPTNEKYSVMFAKDSPLAAQFNDVISELKNEGFIAELHSKWFGAEAGADTTTVNVAEMPALK
jgi:polar amino acid transport system substrate-binding protein